MLILKSGVKNCSFFCILKYKSYICCVKLLIKTQTVMIYSEVLCKSYKSEAGLKGQLTKYIKAQKQELAEVQECVKKNWVYYLGEPIFRVRRELELDVLNAEKELKNLKK